MDVSYYQYDHGGAGDGQYLPPGFRFHPTDEELITHYLLRKVLDGCFTSRAIAEVDLNKCEPWQLPGKAKMGEKEWYFFSLRDRKYPTGLRTNRATEAGYWKATGKDREIYSSKTCALVGMKKTLVFYKGRAPKGEKSNWVMHEYRLEGKFSYHFISRSSKDEWVISRVFQKSGIGSNNSNGVTVASVGVGKNTKIPSEQQQQQLKQPSSPSSSVSLPPLLPVGSSLDNSSCSYDTTRSTDQHVSCFSTASLSTLDSFNHLLPPPPPPPTLGFDPFQRFVSRNGGVSTLSNFKAFQENSHYFGSSSVSTNLSAVNLSSSSSSSQIGVNYWLPATAEENETKTSLIHAGIGYLWNY